MGLFLHETGGGGVGGTGPSSQPNLAYSVRDYSSTRQGGVGGTGPSSQPSLAHAVRDSSFANERAAERGGGGGAVGRGGGGRGGAWGVTFPDANPDGIKHGHSGNSLQTD